jgi:hypothetical protein
LFYFIAKRANDFSDYFVLVLLIFRGEQSQEKSTKAPRCCRNFSVPVRDGTIYVTIDKTGWKVLP